MPLRGRSLRSLRTPAPQAPSLEKEAVKAKPLRGALSRSLDCLPLPEFNGAMNAPF